MFDKTGKRYGRGRALLVTAVTIVAGVVAVLALCLAMPSAAHASPPPPVPGQSRLLQQPVPPVVQPTCDGSKGHAADACWIAAGGPPMCVWDFYVAGKDRIGKMFDCADTLYSTAAGRNDLCVMAYGKGGPGERLYPGVLSDCLTAAITRAGFKAGFGALGISKSTGKIQGWD
jgi:hypothetical protein